MEAQCKFFDTARHYGFVELSDEADQVVAEFFFHGSRVIGQAPVKGDTVEFFLDDSASAKDRMRGGLAAVDVMVKRTISTDEEMTQWTNAANGV
jgi:cold shock CspA family protein